MNASDARAFWVTSHIANPALLAVLRGPLGRRLGGRLAALRYRGRRTGQTHQLVVQYVRDRDIVWVIPGQPDRKRWWRNLVEPAPVELWLAGEHLHGIGQAIDLEGQSDEIALRAYRMAARGANSGGGSTVIVRIDIDRAP